MILEVIPIFKNKRIWTFWHMGFFKWNFMELKTVNFRFPKIVLIFIGINLLHMVLGKFWEMQLGLRGWFFLFLRFVIYLLKGDSFFLTPSINRRRQSSISRTVFGNDIVKHCQTSGLWAELLNVISAPFGHGRADSSPRISRVELWGQVISAVPLAAAAGDKQHESHLCRVRLIAHQGSAVLEEREDAQEGAPGHLLREDQRVERSEGSAPLIISVCAIAISDCKSWWFH